MRANDIRQGEHYVVAIGDGLLTVRVEKNSMLCYKVIDETGQQHKVRSCYNFLRRADSRDMERAEPAGKEET